MDKEIRAEVNIKHENRNVWNCRVGDDDEWTDVNFVKRMAGEIIRRINEPNKREVDGYYINMGENRERNRIIDLIEGMRDNPNIVDINHIIGINEQWKDGYFTALEEIKQKLSQDNGKGRGK